eukprot:1558998-Amphidinium_carterae.1
MVWWDLQDVWVNFPGQQNDSPELKNTNLMKQIKTVWDGNQRRFDNKSSLGPGPPGLNQFLRI